MRLSPTLSLYLGRQFLTGIGFVLLVLLALVFLFDLVELLRRASGRESAGLGLVLQMALLNLPSLAQKVLPFAALFGAIMTFSRLTRSHELIVARAAGVSVWQFLAPALVIAVLLGGFVVTLFNPLAAIMVSRYEQLEGRFLEGRQSLLAVSATGLWLRQADRFGQSVVHARNVSSAGTDLKDVIVYLYKGTDQFVGRIDATGARLLPGRWLLTDALLTRPEEAAIRTPEYELKTSLTLAQIQESFASPETLSFWSLPRFIRTLEAAGFSATRHRLHWHSVLSTPLLLCAMVLLAATFSLRLTRRGHTGLLIAAGVLAGFLLYFVSDVVHAFGIAGNLPIVLAAWTPTGVCALLGLSMLLHLEDG
ncbi:MAG: LPS export ABC transporter permease LptG [Alphaproteobacteria bacterium]|jgi:lipopolysaccharide export system permease protein|nr:LPS export ABC transporter permease LptG [Alphaproteobacteria bacterium]